MVRLLKPALAFAACAGIAGAATPLVEFIEAPENAVKIDVHAAIASPRPVSRLLFGKFTEHLGRNIYGGMWAQVLTNPGFEDWRYFGRTREEAANVTSHFLGGVTWKELIENEEKGIAFGWMAYGGDCRFSRDPDAACGECAQKIESTAGGAGVMQPIYLPLHREHDYEVTFRAKAAAAGGSVCFSIGAWPPEKRVLARATVSGIGTGWQRYRAGLTVESGTVARGEILAFAAISDGPGTIWLDQVFLFPRDHVEGFDRDVVRLVEESRLPLLRYPGGNFASGYHWKDGIGPVDGRPLRRNPAWEVPEYNHVGTDEFMAFCRIVGCEALICVNAGDGTPQEAAEWVEYCNGGPATRLGALRAKNGHPEPYGIQRWEIGNELYGSWQIGHCTAEEYAERYERFYRAMKAVDPAIMIIANGQDAAWNAPLIERKSGILRSLSIHSLIGDGFPADADPEKVFESLMGYTYHYEEYLRGLGRLMAATCPTPRFAVTELQIFTNKPQLPNNQTLAEALFLSGIMDTCIRLDGLVELVTHSALVNHGGGLGKSRGIVFPHPVHLVTHLYGTQSGVIPVKITVRTPLFDVPAWHVPAVKNVPYLDAVALIDGVGDELTIIATNRHPRRDFAATVAVHDFVPCREVGVRTISGPSYLSRNSWEKPDTVALTPSKAQIEGDTLSITFPAHSITSLCLRRQR
jgi:alpha-L-arabinofuranosidase